MPACSAGSRDASHESLGDRAGRSLWARRRVIAGRTANRIELQSLDLQGTEMLVLSQCRMADGIPSSGEGVFGMRRAAAIAGVKTSVAPLWKVDDASQQTLMNRFYRELSAGKGRAEALRAAQLQLLKNPKTASFLQWAPVILSGDPGPLPRALFAK